MHSLLLTMLVDGTIHQLWLHRKHQLTKALLPGESLDISKLKKTPEGLQEYWIQWKNKNTQAECIHK